MQRFRQLNDGWNAEPNAPEPCISIEGDGIILRFLLNPFQFTEFEEGQEAELLFKGCWRYRLGRTNDEGWYRGQCRFSGRAPAWGEFYEIEGDLLVDFRGLEWRDGPAPQHDGTFHFLFYLRDETFECDADGWNLQVLPPTRTER